MVGRGREKISREIGVLVENENDLVRVKPTVPEIGVDGAQRRPKVNQC